MIDLHKLLKHLDITEDSKLESTEPEPCIIEQFPNEEITWNIDVLPITKYIKNKSPKNLSKIENLYNRDINTIEPKKIARILTTIDIMLLQCVSAEDLIEYDAKNIPTPIRHLQNKNMGLLQWFSAHFEHNYLMKILKYSVLYKNYNLMNIVLLSLQTKKLTNKQIEKLIFYKKLLENQESGIFPFEWMLKDCEDSNLNVESEIASMRFCKIVDKLNEMRKIPVIRKLKESHKQYILGNIWKNLNSRLILSQKKHKTYQGLYLVI
jgi:hypothetical protein